MTGAALPMLPDAFADLERFATTWCLPTEQQRYDQRLKSTMPDLTELYEATFPRYADAMKYLDTFPLRELPEKETNLLHLLYSFISVSLAIDMWQQPSVIDSGNACFYRSVEPVP
jgi:hypothetical protein